MQRDAFDVFDALDTFELLIDYLCLEFISNISHSLFSALA